MIDPNVALDNIVAALQAMSNLTSYLGGISAISAYRDRYPVETGVTDAINNAPYPSIIVTYQGMVSAPFGSATIESWKHRFSLWIRCPKVDATENPYAKLLNLVMNDIPGIGSNTEPFKRYQFHEDLYELNPIRSGDVEFRRIVNGQEDFWELKFILTEIGDL